MIGSRIIRLEDTDSTNAYIQRLLTSGNWEEGLVVSAKHQSAGRGQKGTRWVSSPATNLLMSVLLYPDFLRPDRQFLLSQAIALSVRDTIGFYLPDISVQIKWPNDIWANGRKIAGILIENTLQGNCIKSSITGIGINVNESPPDYSAVSIAELSEREISPEKIESKLIQLLDAFYHLLKESPLQIETLYMEHLLGFGIPMQFHDHSRDCDFTGIIKAITPEGRLLVNNAGEILSFDLKEISLI